MAEEKAAEAGREDKLTALHDAMTKMCDRMDAFMKKHDRRDDDDDDDDDRRRDRRRDRRDDDDDDDDKRKDAKRRDKEFGEWAKEEEKEEEHKDSKRRDRRKDAEEESEESPVKEKAHEDPEHEKAAEKDDKRKDDDDDDDDDDKRKDAEEEGEGSPEPMASDDKRRDRRKDDDDDDDDDDKRKDRRDARMDSYTRSLERRLAALERDHRTPRVLSDEQLNQLSAEQHEWDKVAQAHGQKAPRFMDGESPDAYNRRLVRMFQKHSPRWKNEDMGKLPLGMITRVITPEVRADAVRAAYNPSVSPNGMQHMITREDQTGRRYYEFAGPVDAPNGTLAPFKMPALRVKRINTNPGVF